MRDKEILLITKGHPFARDAFFSVFDALPGIAWTHVEQPAAQAFFEPALARPYDAFVLYDMPGIRFRRDGPPDFLEPAEDFKRHFAELLAQGIGLVRTLLANAVVWASSPEAREWAQRRNDLDSSKQK